MRIITPEEIEQVAWEGALKPSGQSFSKGVTAPPRVTMGEPVWWPAEQALESETGKKWTPPAGGQRYTLVRLSCTLHPPAEARTRYTDVTLTAYLRPHAAVGAAVAHDLYPLRETAETKGKFTVEPGAGAEVRASRRCQTGRDRRGDRVPQGLPGDPGVRAGREPALLAVQA